MHGVWNLTEEKFDKEIVMKVLFRIWTFGNPNGVSNFSFFPQKNENDSGMRQQFVRGKDSVKALVINMYVSVMVSPL